MNSPKSKEPVRNRETARPSRKSLEDQLSRLEIISGQDPEYSYRWVNDTHEGGQRIYKLTERGYEFASPTKHKVASAHAFDTDVYGSVIRKADGKNGSYNFLMRIKQEFHEEDLAFKKQQADEAIEDIYTKHTDADGDVYSKQIRIN